MLINKILVISIMMLSSVSAVDLNCKKQFETFKKKEICNKYLYDMKVSQKEIISFLNEAKPIEAMNAIDDVSENLIGFIIDDCYKINNYNKEKSVELKEAHRDYLKSIFFERKEILKKIERNSKNKIDHLELIISRTKKNEKERVKKELSRGWFE